ncbi:Armadillo-type fold [Pseudocohnilembus persalinus]|uniref:Armadillo-type fold n=1 Tax=Pseudocohnilembus persalinus TaxID=266149 RepID=A0A0V0Q9I4_PSEPJ|nr:Armadillo-type fold [Pseudocohnilembus persalinus]|eukprot:KRW98893.1 Armadillo-type fold [Pseudocohnilembus persalinus]
MFKITNNQQFMTTIILKKLFSINRPSYEAIPALQDKAFLALFCLDYPGFYALLDIANKDFQNVPDFILNKLAQTEEIQLSVIIPSLLNDINTGEPKKKVQSLAAMNRMFSLVYKAGGLPLLIQLLQEGSIDRQLIVSTIRACGDVGEQALIKLK